MLVQSHKDRDSDRTLALPALLFGLVLLVFWFVARHFSVEAHIGGHMPTAFLSFVLLLAPYWFFGFGAADLLHEKLTHPAARVLAPGLLVLPYLLFSIPHGEFQWSYAAIFFTIPVGLAALFEFVPPEGGSGKFATKTKDLMDRSRPRLRGSLYPEVQKLCWQDVLALAIIGVPVEFRLLAGSFPHPGLSALPKFLLLDAALYAFLVVRQVEGAGYDFRAKVQDVLIGLREWAFFAPIAIGLGLALGFITFHRVMPSAATIGSALMITFFFVAIPEELFFRGLLQNMLEARIGHPKSLFVAAVIFGLSHFNKPLPFNWRYVLLATIAGLFYGRAWRNRRRLFASGITHTLVDVVWGLWFK